MIMQGDKEVVGELRGFDQFVSTCSAFVMSACSKLAADMVLDKVTVR